MRGGGDYVIKRVLFAIVTVFVAITLNFVIFRAAPGDATSAMRCLACTPQVRAEVRHELGRQNDVVIERDNIRFVAHVPDQVEWAVERVDEEDVEDLEDDQ